MLVVYRIAGIPSTNPSPVYQEDKRKLNELCLKSFVFAFRNVNPKMHFLLDLCDDSYIEMLKELVPFEYKYEMTELGINGTALRAYEVAEQANDLILFQECDYLYRGSVGVQVEEAIRHFKLFSPYDHPDFYERYDIHPLEVELQIFGGTHFRKSRRNTMTFGMTKQAFTDCKHILNKYGYLDNDVWIEMATHGYKLWTPIPAFATHMAKDYMSPAVPWEVLIGLYK